MGILVENLEAQTFEFFLKGADSVMMEKLSENERIFVNEESELLSNEGI